MSIKERFRQINQNMQGGAKHTIHVVSKFLLKLLTGILLGLIFALIGEQVINYDKLVFTFVIVTILMMFFYISRKWSIIFILIFDLLFVLFALLLKMYIMMAPNV